MIPVLTTVWGLRLSGYLLLRRIGAPEDFRYRNMRSAHPFSFPVRSLLTIFSLQGVLMWIVAMPLQTVSRPLIPPYVVALIGLLLWVTGFVFESVGDWQLARFRSDPSNDGRLMNHGLWRYTRHPNYFGDFLVWWGLFFLALSAGAPWWSVVGPVLLSVLLLRVSGVTLLEKSLRNRKEGYADYVARTNAFFLGGPGRRSGVPSILLLGEDAQ